MITRKSLKWHVVLVCRDCLAMFEVESVLFEEPKSRAVLKAPKECPRCAGKAYADEKEVEEWQ